MRALFRRTDQERAWPPSQLLAILKSEYGAVGKNALHLGQRHRLLSV